MSSMNPQITTVQIGVKSLREITLYPLSMADQFQMTELISEEINNFTGTDFGELSDVETVEMVFDVVKRNLIKILSFVTDENETVAFEEITNTQLVDIATKVYEVNFDVFAKNWKTLKQKIPGAMSHLNEQSLK